MLVHGWPAEEPGTQIALCFWMLLDLLAPALVIDGQPQTTDLAEHIVLAAVSMARVVPSAAMWTLQAPGTMATQLLNGPAPSPTVWARVLKTER